MSHKPRVLMVGPFPPSMGGVTTFMLNVIGSSLSRDYEFVEFTTTRLVNKDTVTNWGYASMWSGGFLHLVGAALLTLWHLVKFPFVVSLRRITLVQIQSSDFQVFWESACYAAMGRMLGRPTLMRLGGAFDHFFAASSPRVRTWIQRVLEIPSVLIVQSEYWRDFVARAGRHADVLVLANSVSGRMLDEFPEERPARENGPVTALFLAGSEAQRKGIDPLLSAFRTVWELGLDIRLEILAASPGLQSRIESEGLSARTICRAEVDRGTVLAAMTRADFFVLPSFAEGFPNALLEAMAAGLPAIATPVGAVPEVLEDGKGGILIEPGDVDALAGALQKLVGDPELRARMGDHNRSRVRDRYTAEAILPRLASVYRCLVDPEGEEEGGMTTRVDIDQVRTFWDAHPCGSETSEQRERKAFFEEVEAKRYAVEPHIPALAGFQEYAGRDVLELGCGVGTDGRRFAEAGARYRGVDLSRQSLRLARENFDLHELSPHFANGNGEQLPFADGSFHHVYSFGVVHHSPDTEKIVSEIRRVLRPGGTFCVMVYNRTSANYYVQILFLRRALRWLLWPAFAPRLIARITGFEEAKLQRHRELLRRPMSKDQWISANTNGAKVYSRPEVEQLFREFEDLRTEVSYFNQTHWPGLARLLPASLRDWLGRRAGWHRTIYGRRPSE